MTTNAFVAQPTVNDNVKGGDAAYFTWIGAGAAALPVAFDPPQEQDSAFVGNFSNYDLVLQVNGKNAAGATIAISKTIVPPGGASVSFAAYNKLANIQEQVIADVTLLPVARPITGGLSAPPTTGATLPAGTVVQAFINFNNQ